MAEMRCIRCLVGVHGGDLVHEVLYLVDGDAICEAHALEIVDSTEDDRYIEWAAAQTWNFTSYSRYAFTFETKDADGVRGIALLALENAGDLYRVDVGNPTTWYDLVNQGELDLRVIDAKGVVIYSNT